MTTPRAVEVLPTPQGATIGSLTVSHPFLGTFVNRNLATSSARFVRAPQIYVYECPVTGLFYAFEAVPRIPGT